MNQRLFGKTGRMVTEIGLGTWQLGTKWGDPFNPEEAERILEAAYDAGITLIDTADGYNGGNSEKAIGSFIKKHPDHFFVTTKIGRRSNPHTAESYNEANLTKYVDACLERLQLEKLDLVLLHCPPTPVFSNDEVFAIMDKMKKAGKILNYGVSIEKVSEGLAAMKYDISAIEVIYNMFRMKPEKELFPAAKANNVGILARVPLASGILTGKFRKDTVFGPKDHRTFNRNGESFDKGETFSGVDYATGIEAAEELKKLFGTEELAPIAIRWILMYDAVSTVIPGASRKEQVLSNVKAAEVPPLTDEQMAGVRAIYDKYIKDSVECLW